MLHILNTYSHLRTPSLVLETHARTHPWQVLTILKQSFVDTEEITWHHHASNTSASLMGFLRRYEFTLKLVLVDIEPSLTVEGRQTTEVKVDRSFCLKSFVVRVYKSGFKAELTGKMKTMTHAYSSRLTETPGEEEQKLLRESDFFICHICQFL